MNIVQYVRDENGNRIGVVIVVEDRRNEHGSLDGIRIGWSKCNLDAGDRFDKSFGMGIAINRALCDRPVRVSRVPKCVRNVFYNVVDRARRYYHMDVANIV
jgi:hypothetical protein